MMKKLDPQEENRKLLLAGGDPTKRQRELQVLCFLLALLVMLHHQKTLAHCTAYFQKLLIAAD